MRVRSPATIGQSKPFPSPVYRGTRWKWKCGTDWNAAAPFACSRLRPSGRNGLADGARDAPGGGDRRLEIRLVGVEEGGGVDARNDQRVALVQRVDVHERDRALVLVHPGRGDLSVSDPAEHAVHRPPLSFLGLLVHFGLDLGEGLLGSLDALLRVRSRPLGFGLEGLYGHLDGAARAVVERLEVRRAPGGPATSR